MSKLALGTAQFGLDYGINNTRGKIPQEEIFQILDFACQNGIDMLDTAPAYGSSQKVIGQYLAARGGKLNVVSKLSKGSFSDVRKAIHNILAEVNLNTIYGLIYHSIDDFKADPDSWKVLEEQKAAGKVNKIGFSLYTADALEYILEKDIGFDLVQAPYSVLDRRFEKYFSILSEKGVEIHVRSVFLQGLVFKAPDELAGHFLKIKDKLLALKGLAQKNGLTVASLCLNFAKANKFVGKVVTGVDSLSNLKELIGTARDMAQAQALFGAMSDLREEDESIILPFNWTKGMN